MKTNKELQYAQRIHRLTKKLLQTTKAYNKLVIEHNRILKGMLRMSKYNENFKN